MAIVNIVSRWNHTTVLFTTTVPDNVHPAHRTSRALRAAIEKGRDMTGADLSYCALAFVDLSRAKLEGALFRGTNLRHTRFALANLEAASFFDCNMSFADLQGANLKGANFASCNMAHAYLAKARFDRSTCFTSTNLRGARMEGAAYQGVKLGRRGAIAAALRSDGHSFQLIDCADGEFRVMAGCRWFTLPQAWKHWEYTRRNTDLGEETFDILVMFEHQAERANTAKKGAAS